MAAPKPAARIYDNSTRMAKASVTTYNLGFGGSFGFIGFLSGSVGIMFDTNWHAGFYRTSGGGASTGLNVGMDVQVGRSSGNVRSQRGRQAFGGASVGLGPGGGIDFTDNGAELNVGIGAKGEVIMPFEGHAGVQDTAVYEIW